MIKNFLETLAEISTIFVGLVAALLLIFAKMWPLWLGIAAWVYIVNN